MASITDSSPSRAPGDPYQKPGSVASATASRGRGHAALAWALGLGVAALGLAGCQAGGERQLAEAHALQDAGQFKESIEPLRAILAETPDAPEVNHLLGLALMRTGQESLAVWPLEKAMESPEYLAPSGLLLATVFLGNQSYEDAIRITDRVLGADPERSEALRVRAQANLAAGRHDEALADTQRLAELFPEDFQVGILRGAVLTAMKRNDEAESVYRKLKDDAQKSGDVSLAARGCLALAHFYDETLHDRKRSEPAYRECLTAYPADPLALQLGVAFYDVIGKPDEGTAAWRRAVSEAPENFSFQVSLATRLASRGDPEGAEKLLREATEAFGSATAWQVLADFLRRRGANEDALAAAEKALELSGGGDEALRFAQADILLDLGRIEQAEQIAQSLGEGPYRDLIRGRVLLLQGDAAGALAALDAGIRRWPNNAAARYLAALAAQQAGDNRRVDVELTEALRIDAKATDAGLWMARLALERGNAKDAAGLAKSYIETHGAYSADPYLILARAAVMAGQYDDARRTLTGLAAIASQRLPATVDLAALERRASGAAAAARVIETSGLDLTDPANELALRSLAEDLVAQGKADAALGRVDAAIATQADRASLHGLRGAILARAGRPAEAQSAYEKALAMDAGSALALAGLGALRAETGDSAAAIELLDRAAKADPSDPVPAYQAAQLLLAAGRTDEAEARLRDLVSHGPGLADARNDLAWLLAEKGQDLELALALAQQAVAQQETPSHLDTLGWVELKLGRTDAAIASFERALAQSPKASSIRYRLGLALAKKGEPGKALAALREALAAGPFAEAEAARQEIARLELP